MSGLGAFIDGAMRGYSYGMSVEDAKYRRERQKKDDAWTDKARQRQETEWARQDEAFRRAEEERSVLAAIGQEAVASYQNDGEVIEGTATEVPSPANQQPEPVTVSTRNAVAAERGVIDAAPTAPQQPGAPAVNAAPQPGQPVRRHSGPRGIGVIDADAAPKADTQPAVSKSEAVSILARDPAIQVMAKRRGMTPEEYVVSMSPEAFAHNLSRITDPKPFDKAADDAAYAAGAPQRGEGGAPWPTQADLDQRYQEDQRADRFSYASSRQTPQAPAPGTAPQAPAPGTPVARHAAPTAPAQPGAGIAPQADTRPAQPMPPEVAADPQVAKAVEAPVAPSMAPEAQADIQATHERAVSAPPDQGGSPSVAVAAATAPKGRGVVGKDGAIKATEGQREKAAKSFMDHYAETAVPKLVEYYASKGDLEKAQAFEDWAKSREAKSQMASWSKAVHAAAIGDDDGFLDHLADTYNSYDDGYEVVRKGSGFNRDEQGNITGATVQFRNTKTGEVFTQEYADQSDIIELGIYALSPEQVFEQLYGQLAQAAEVAAEQRQFERDLMLEQAKSGMKAPAENAKLIAGAKKALSEQMLPGQWAKLSPEEQDAAAIEYVRRNRQAGGNLSLPPAPAPYTGR